MPTLAERRAQQAANPTGGANGDFIKFKQEGETRILRFLFNDAGDLEVKLKYPLIKNEQGKWVEDTTGASGKGSYRVTLNCVEYNTGGSGARRVRWEISEYLYNEYLAAYIEKDIPASKNVWEVKVRRPGKMDVSYLAFKVDGATELTYPIPEAANSNDSSAAAAPAAPTYAQPAPVAQPVAQPPQQPAAQPAPTAQPSAPVAQPTAAPQAPPEQPAPVAQKKSKYF